jgi:hypothetical protein
MELSKLFRVLVVGGGMLAGGACEVAPGAGRLQGLADTDPARDAGTADAAASESSPCFCGPDVCCEQQPDGTASVQEGFFCCWGTAC